MAVDWGFFFFSSFLYFLLQIGLFFLTEGYFRKYNLLSAYKNYYSKLNVILKNPFAPYSSQKLTKQIKILI